MLSIDGKQDRAARGHAPDRIGACASARSSSCARWRRALILGTLLVACIPAGAAGWVKLLSQTAAEKFEEEDLRMFLESARDTLNAEGTPKTVEWSNAKNQTGGTFLVVGESTRNGLQCRRLKFSTYAPGYPNPPKGSTTWTACTTADGRWKLAEAK